MSGGKTIGVMRKIVIRNLSDAKDEFSCILVCEALSQKEDISYYQNIKLVKLRENESEIEYKLINIDGE